MNFHIFTTLRQNLHLSYTTIRKLLRLTKLNLLNGGSIVKRSLTTTALLVLIDLKRKDMYKKAQIYGFTHPIVVTCSQELDQLLNRYQQKVS